ncbi:MAG: ATPase domain-containing protein [archaeon]|nr:ATPase domain-containing protein [archaeon]
MADRPASISQQVRPESSEVSLIAVSKEMDLTKSLLVILRKMLVEDRNMTLLILSSMPTEQFVARSREFGLDLETFLRQKRLVLLDCITKFTQTDEESRLIPLRSDVFYASSPSDLSEISVRLSEALASDISKGEKWMILDSITTLSLYNTTGGFLRFMQFLFRKLRLLNFDGTMIVVRDESSDAMIQALKQYCSKIIFIAPSSMET